MIVYMSNLPASVFQIYSIEWGATRTGFLGLLAIRDRSINHTVHLKIVMGTSVAILPMLILITLKGSVQISLFGIFGLRSPFERIFALFMIILFFISELIVIELHL